MGSIERKHTISSSAKISTSKGLARTEALPKQAVGEHDEVFSAAGDTVLVTVAAAVTTMYGSSEEGAAAGVASVAVGLGASTISGSPSGDSDAGAVIVTVVAMAASVDIADVSATRLPRGMAGLFSSRAHVVSSELVMRLYKKSEVSMITKFLL